MTSVDFMTTWFTHIKHIIRFDCDAELEAYETFRQQGIAKFFFVNLFGVTGNPTFGEVYSYEQAAIRNYQPSLNYTNWLRANKEWRIYIKPGVDKSKIKKHRGGKNKMGEMLFLYRNRKGKKCGLRGWNSMN